MPISKCAESKRVMKAYADEQAMRKRMRDAEIMGRVLNVITQSDDEPGQRTNIDLETIVDMWTSSMPMESMNSLCKQSAKCLLNQICSPCRDVL